MPSDITPFKGRTQHSPTPTRIVRRFTKSGHVAEIHERAIAAFNAVEFIVFIDGVLRYSQLFHGKKLTDYPSTLNARANQFTDKGWIEQVSSVHGL